VADDDRAGGRRLGGDSLEPARASHPMGGQPADLPGDLGRRGGHGVVLVRVDPHHARAHLGAEADREDGAERDRHLAEDVAGLPVADDLRDPVEVLDRLDLSGEQAEERPLAALVGGVLARLEPDVGGSAGEPLALRERELREDRDPRDLVGGHHAEALRGRTRTTYSAARAPATGCTVARWRRATRPAPAASSG
jgi:hypothetical protein